MKSGTEKKPNPKSSSLFKYLRARERSVSRGYVGFRNGQIMREDTWKCVQAGAPTARQQRRNRRAAKQIHEPAKPVFRDRKAKVPHPLPGSKKRKLKALRSLNKPQNSYPAAVSELRKAAKSGYTGHTIPDRAPMPNRQIAAWSHIWRSA